MTTNKKHRQRSVGFKTKEGTSLEMRDILSLRDLIALSMMIRRIAIAYLKCVERMWKIISEELRSFKRNSNRMKLTF